MPANASETLVRETLDPDLGALVLWLTRVKTVALPISKQTAEYSDWRGRLGPDETPLVISIDGDADETLGFIDAKTRKLIRSLPARAAQLKSDAAAKMLMLAREWAENEALSQEELAAMLRLSEVSVLADAEGSDVQLWFEESGDIFAGHSVMARLDGEGQIDDIGLEG